MFKLNFKNIRNFFSKKGFMNFIKNFGIFVVRFLINILYLIVLIGFDLTVVCFFTFTVIPNLLIMSLKTFVVDYGVWYTSSFLDILVIPFLPLLFAILMFFIFIKWFLCSINGYIISFFKDVKQKFNDKVENSKIKNIDVTDVVCDNITNDIDSTDDITDIWDMTDEEYRKYMTLLDPEFCPYVDCDDNSCKN